MRAAVQEAAAAARRYDVLGRAGRRQLALGPLRPHPPAWQVYLDERLYALMTTVPSLSVRGSGRGNSGVCCYVCRGVRPRRAGNKI